MWRWASQRRSAIARSASRCGSTLCPCHGPAPTRLTTCATGQIIDGRGYPGVDVRRRVYLMLRRALPPPTPPQGDSTLWERNELIVRYAKLHEIQCSAVRDSIYSQTCAWRCHCVHAGIKCRVLRVTVQERRDTQCMRTRVLRASHGVYACVCVFVF